MNKANRIPDDVLCIIAVIILPWFLLRILGYERTVRENDTKRIM